MAKPYAGITNLDGIAFQKGLYVGADQLETLIINSSGTFVGPISPTGNLNINGTLTVSGSTTLSILGTGLVHAGATGKLSSSLLVDADVSASAAIAYSKLATLTSGNILVGNSSNVATSVAMSGDVTISNAGVTAIGSSKVTNTMLAGSIAYSKLVLTTSIVNGDISASAAIAGTKISPDFGSQNVTTTGVLSGKGTTAGTAASAGFIGEELTGTQSSFASTGSTGAYFSATSVSLTAGDWDVSGYISYHLNTGTGMTFTEIGLGTNNNAAPNASYEYASPTVPTGSSDYTIALAPVRVTISSTTTYYLIGACTFSGGQPQYKANIRARRMR